MNRASGGNKRCGCTIFSTIMPACALAQASSMFSNAGWHRVVEAILSSRRLIPKRKFPRLAIEEIFTYGDKVAKLWKISGTPQDHLRDFAPSNQPIYARGILHMTFFRLFRLMTGVAFLISPQSILSPAHAQDMFRLAYGGHT